MAPYFKDQSDGLTVFGVFEFFAAFFIGLAKLFGIYSMKANGKALASFTLALGVIEVAKRLAFGWGSIKARRWARAIILLSSWFNLGIGLLICPLMFWMINRAFLKAPHMTPGFRFGFSLVITGFMVVFAVGIPLIFVLFYKRDDVRETCETRNPNPSWTDACPLPVLGYCLLLALGAAYMLPMAVFAHFQYPLLIWAIGGVRAKMIIALMAFASLYAATQVYRLSMRGFWLAAGLMAVGFINTAVFYAARGWEGMMSLMGDTLPLQKDVFQALPGLKPMIGVIMIGSFAGATVYMMFLKKKYFSNQATAQI